MSFICRPLYVTRLGQRSSLTVKSKAVVPTQAKWILYTHDYIVLRAALLTMFSCTEKLVVYFKIDFGPKFRKPEDHTFGFSETSTLRGGRTH